MEPRPIESEDDLPQPERGDAWSGELTVEAIDVGLITPPRGRIRHQWGLTEREHEAREERERVFVRF